MPVRAWRETVPLRHPLRYHRSMAVNLRLDPEIAEALREEAGRTGRSQQQLIRDAIAEHLGRSRSSARAPTDLDDLVRAGRVRAPRIPLRTSVGPIPLVPGVTTEDLLDREDRL